MFSATANWTGVPAGWRLAILAGLLILGLLAICVAAVLHDEESASPAAAEPPPPIAAARPSAPAAPVANAAADDDLGAPFRSVGSTAARTVSRSRPAVDWVTLAEESAAPAPATAFDADVPAESTFVASTSRSPAGVA
jgi:hypothetical protein